jgi:DNA end-binding protein Ku
MKISPNELQMAKSLVQSLAEDTFDPSRYQDEYHDALMKVVNAKVEGQQVISAPEAGPEPKVMDLMEALRASVDAAKKQKSTREPARTRKTASRSKAS